MDVTQSNLLDLSRYLLRTDSKLYYQLENQQFSIEYYLEQLKIKMNCHTKSYLIEKGMSLGHLNFMPQNLMSPNISQQFIVD